MATYRQQPRRPTPTTKNIHMRQPQRSAPYVFSASQRMRAINPMPPAPQRMQPHPAYAGKPRKQSNHTTWLIIGGFGLLASLVFLCMFSMVGLMLFSGGNDILRGVSVAGIPLGGLSEQEAVARLTESYSTVTLRDGERFWTISPTELGININPTQTAENAHEIGRGIGNRLTAVFSTVEVNPVYEINFAALRDGLSALSGQVSLPAMDAGVRLVDGRVEPTEPVYGRSLNIESTIAILTSNMDTVLSSREMRLVMDQVTPQIVDSSPMVTEAERLLQSPLQVNVYDPATGDTVVWSALPAIWSNWISASSSGGQELHVSLRDQPVRDFLQQNATVFDPIRYLEMDEAVATVQQAIANNQTTSTIRVHHNDRQHTVQPGESITSIAWDYGVPYPWIQQANPGVDALTVGQTITIPSMENFWPNPVVTNKRIVVSISEQRTRVYENGALLWDWAASTGISNSPTWPGVYQILSHEQNAYAGNWDLWMPYFMGVYQPIPGSDFTNGFHGYPTRGGGQLLWQNSLGTRVTYGCILLDNANASRLYEWAETGVIVEIRA